MLYSINGKFLNERITGMQRYAYEIIGELDKICQKGELEIIVPKGTKNIPEYKNIKVVPYGNMKSGKFNSIMWEQYYLANYLLKNKRKCINLLSVVPLLMQKGIIVAHGVNYKVNPQYFKTFRDKMSRLWHIVNFNQYFKHTEKIVTVSNFSKSEIMKTYGVPENRISIASNAWQHMLKVEESNDMYDRYPFLKDKEFYFSMSSINDNKNFKWIVKIAEKNTESCFAIAGGRSLQEYLNRCGIKKPDNLYFLGYVTDEDAKALMSNCKAFLFPTFYEGFGIPPLEAMSCGACAVVSDTPTMHEVYENSVHYIDPYSYDVDLDELLKEPVDSPDKILSKYSWEKSAKNLYKVIKS